MDTRRVYRDWVEGQGLVTFAVNVGETDLLVAAPRDLSREALASAARHRATVESYVRSHPRFATSLQPVAAREDAPDIARSMASAAALAGVGPLAAVAGAIAEAVGLDLLQLADEVIVENGGDIFMRTRTRRVVGLYAGRSALSGKLGLVIEPEQTPLGICTSSGSFGHSLSFGAADACTVLARSVALADAVATSLANRIRSAADLGSVLSSSPIPADVVGVFATVDSQVAIWGDIRLTLIDAAKP
ncbi:MAG: UPF0280 family protein [Dehalococcoidia bacterium]|nr:UPF0280 family protein [Dehalococcoidia bacterium]